MRLNKLLLLLSLVLPINAVAAFDNHPAGGRSAAISNASVSLTDLWSSFNNQAGLAYITSPAGGISYESRFQLQEMSYKSVAFAYPLKSGTIALSSSQYGFKLWSESKVGLAYARRFGRYFSGGIQLDYFYLNKEDPYGNKSILTFEIGILSKISNKITVGFQLSNPLNSSISDYSDERLPACLRLGASYTISESFTLMAETEKQIHNDPSFKCGVEYTINKFVCFRTGVNTSLSSFSFGTGIRYAHFQFDLSSSYHQVLGFSPQASVTYLF